MVLFFILVGLWRDPFRFLQIFYGPFEGFLMMDFWCILFSNFLS